MPAVLASPSRLESIYVSRSPEEQERAERFAAWLRARMTERGVGVNQLHEYADIAASLISGYLQAKRVPSAKNAVKLANFFRRPVREVLILTGHPTGDADPIQPFEIMAAHGDSLSPEQWDEVVKYAEWVLERDRRQQEDR